MPETQVGIGDVKVLRVVCDMQMNGPKMRLKKVKVALASESGGGVGKKGVRVDVIAEIYDEGDDDISLRGT